MFRESSELSGEHPETVQLVLKCCCYFLLLEFTFCLDRKVGFFFPDKMSRFLSGFSVCMWESGLSRQFYRWYSVLRYSGTRICMAINSYGTPALQQQIAYESCCRSYTSASSKKERPLYSTSDYDGRFSSAQVSSICG